MAKLTSKEISNLVFALVGDIGPIIDGANGTITLKNVETLIEIAKDLHLKIDEIATKYSQSRYYSERKVGERCEQYLDWLGIEKNSK